ncbi:protein FAM174C [Fundulus heteroclitus]|uniref:protein FAM174C n=1 Tax=Fundulus heteroclitus TaxID=8078 RepID=UPI00165BC427|nr:protein FAM174C [Fundulus heteroclitus]
MAVWRVLSVSVVYACWLILTAADDLPPATNGTGSGAAPKTGVTSPSRANTPLSGATTNSSRGNSTHRGVGTNGLGVDSSMIQRALYVLIGITIIGVLYFLIRAVRLKKPAQRKKYGLLSNYDDSVEMDAVESEDDDTLYEARSLRR